MVRQLTISDFPLSPSSNNIYLTMGRFRVPSQEFKAYKKDCKQWAIDHPKTVAILKRTLSEWLAAGYLIAVDCYFVFEHSRLWTKVSKQNPRSKPKKLDGSNRLKAAHDALAEIVGIDDCYFWNAGCEKVSCTESGNEGIIMVMRPTRARKWLDVLESIEHST